MFAQITMCKIRTLYTRTACVYACQYLLFIRVYVYIRMCMHSSLWLRIVHRTHTSSLSHTHAHAHNLPRLVAALRIKEVIPREPWCPYPLACHQRNDRSPEHTDMHLMGHLWLNKLVLGAQVSHTAVLLPTNGIYSSQEFIRAGKSSFTCEIAVLDGNFDHKILLSRENPFHVTNLTYSDLEPALLIYLIGPWEVGVLKICLWLLLLGYVTVSCCGCVAEHRG